MYNVSIVNKSNLAEFYYRLIMMSTIELVRGIYDFLKENDRKRHE